MTQRKPGDYVVNAELTDEQRERFIADCVAAGAEDDGDAFDADNEILLCHSEGDAFRVGGYYFQAISLDGGFAAKNDVTEEYAK